MGVHVFSFFAYASRRLKKSGKENKEERRLAQKQKKPNLTKMLDSALPSCTLYKFVTFSISVGLLKWVYSSSTKMSMILSVSILLNCSRARIAVVNSSRVTCEKNHRTKRVKTLQQTFPFWSSSISAKVLEVMNSFELDFKILNENGPNFWNWDL